MKRIYLLPAILSAVLMCSVSLYAAAGAVKGNANSKVYHAASCKHYKAKGSKVEFKSASEAQKAGYKGCKQCIKSDPTKKK